MERFFERAAELPAASRLVEGFRRFAGDAGVEVAGPPLRGRAGDRSVEEPDSGDSRDDDAPPRAEASTTWS